MISELLDIMNTEQDTLLFNGQEHIHNRPRTIRNALQKLSAGNTRMPLTISADGNTPHQYVVTAMDVAGKLGFVKINIATMNNSAEQ